MPSVRSAGRLIVSVVAFGIVLASNASAADGLEISGVVTERNGASIAGAQVALLDSGQAVLAGARTESDGTFKFRSVPPGSYLVRVEFPGFAVRRIPANVQHGPASLTIVLEPVLWTDELTVTESPGRVETVATVPQQVNVIGPEDIRMRAKSVVAEVASEEVGVHLQRTSPTLAGIFVRGLTGAKVNVFVDGQRYSTGSARGGINTFMDLIDPAYLDTVEIVRGPTGAQYGADALGGSVQLQTRTPQFSAAGTELSGTYFARANSVDTGLQGSLSGTFATPTLALTGTISARRANTLRAGDGTDSHNAVRRFFDIDPALVLDDGRLPDTSFTQTGGLVTLSWAPSAQDRLVFSYLQTEQDNGKRYDQLIGGDGNLVADLRDLLLDHVSMKYSHSELGPFDSVSVGYSFNRQREERVNQGGNGNPNATITHEPEVTSVHGIQASADKTWSASSLTFGADYYDESVDAPSYGVNPVTGVATTRRGRVPDGAQYKNGGVFVQGVWEAVPERLRLVGNARYSDLSYDARASDSPLVGGQPLWPDDSEDFSATTFRAGAVFTPHDKWTISVNASQGFRAPGITDLGTVGLTGSGFEVSPEEISGLGGTVGTTADATAVSTGRSAEDLDPEESITYETTLRFRTGKLDTSLTGFINDIEGNIQKVALILPPGAVGLTLGDQTITSQTPGGAVVVPASPNPVLVNANFDDARIWGFEYTLGLAAGKSWYVGATATYLHAEDRNTHRPPNIEGGTPAPDAWLRARYAPEGKRWWVEPYVHAASSQDRLSSLDLGDRRTGASRSRTSIGNFFNNGARARGLVGNGVDTLPGTPDDVLLATGETLVQIQDRVLGAASAAPLYTEVPSYVVFSARAGYMFAPGHELVLDVENIGDTNYRGISWGVDAPGFGVWLSYAGRF